MQGSPSGQFEFLFRSRPEKHGSAQRVEAAGLVLSFAMMVLGGYGLSSESQLMIGTVWQSCDGGPTS